MYLHVIYGQLLPTCDIIQHTRAHLIHINIQLQDCTYMYYAYTQFNYLSRYVLYLDMHLETFGFYKTEKILNYM